MYKTAEIVNSEDILDSRDIIKRIEELEEEKDNFLLEHSKLKEEDSPSWLDVANDQAEVSKEWDETEEGEELKALLKVQEEGEGYGDWSHGATLIRDSYFEDYARELARDCGDINGNEKWPLNCIDWEKAADELKDDYTSIDFDGVEYWMRS